MKKKHAPNVTMLQAEATPAVELQPGEHAIALVTLAQGGPPLVVTDARLVQSGETLVRYDDVRHCHWIVRDHEKRHLDSEAAQEMKRLHRQRLILDLKNGREVVLDGLGQAVFPLLKFFWFKLDHERRDCMRSPQRTEAAGMFSGIRKWFGRGPGR